MTDRKCRICRRITQAPCGVCSRHSFIGPNGWRVRHFSAHAAKDCPMALTTRDDRTTVGDTRKGDS